MRNETRDFQEMFCSHHATKSLIFNNNNMVIMRILKHKRH